MTTTALVWSQLRMVPPITEPITLRKVWKTTETLNLIYYIFRKFLKTVEIFTTCVAYFF